MTENKKEKALRRPVRIAVVAAAMAAALGITASAASLPAVRELGAYITGIFVTVNTDALDGVELPVLPEVAVEDRDGRTILHLDGEETDITDALAQDGGYCREGDGWTVTVDADGAATVKVEGEDGMTLTYAVQPGAGTPVYSVAQNGGQTGSYEVTVDSAVGYNVDVEQAD